MNYLVPQQNTGLSQINQIGLGFKLFGKSIKVGKWLKAGLGYVSQLAQSAVLHIPGFGDDLAEMIRGFQGKIENWIDSQPILNGLRGSADGNLTYNEEAILNDWLTAQFIPWVDSLFNDIALAMQLPTQSGQVIALNTILNKIDGAQDYYAVDGQDGLSQNAIDQRQYLVAITLEPVFIGVQKAIATLGLKVTTKPVQFDIHAYDFAPLFNTTIVTLVNGENYVLGNTIKFGGTPIKAGTITDLSATRDLIRKPTNTMVTTPVKTPTQTAPIKTAVPVTQPTTTAPVQTAVPVTQPTTTTQAPVQQAPPTDTTNVDDVATAVTTPVATGSNTPANTNKTDNTNNKTALYIGGALLFAAAIIATRKKKTKPGSKAAKSKK